MDSVKISFAASLIDRVLQYLVRNVIRSFPG